MKKATMRNTDLNLTNEEAVFGVLFSALTADTQITETSTQAFWLMLERIELFEDSTEDNLNDMVDKFSKVYNTHGHNCLMELAARFIPAEHRETMYTLAAELVFCDGVVNYDEKLFLEDLRALLAINANYSNQVVHVMAVRQQLSAAV